MNEMRKSKICSIGIYKCKECGHTYIIKGIDYKQVDTELNLIIFRDAVKDLTMKGVLLE